MYLWHAICGVAMCLAVIWLVVIAMIQKVTAYASPLDIINQLSSYCLHLWSSLKYPVTQKYPARLSHQLSENPLR